MLVGAGAHLVGTAEAQPQLSQDLQHAQATVALDSVKGPDSRQALQKAEVPPHYRAQVGHEEGSDLTLHNKMVNVRETPLPAPTLCMPSLVFPSICPKCGCGHKAAWSKFSGGLPKSTGQMANSPARHARICGPAPPCSANSSCRLNYLFFHRPASVPTMPSTWNILPPLCLANT